MSVLAGVYDEDRTRVAAQVLLDDECLGAGNVGVDPIRLGLQIGGEARPGFISNVEAIKVRIVFECADSSLKISVGSVGETKVNEALDAGRQRIEFRNRADVRQVEAIRSRSIDAIDEISVGCVVQRGGRISHFSSRTRLQAKEVIVLFQFNAHT